MLTSDNVRFCSVAKDAGRDGRVGGCWWTARGDTVRVGCLNRIKWLNGGTAVMQTRLSWSGGDFRERSGQRLGAEVEKK